MAQQNWNDCFDHVLGSEGGFQNDPKDKGNWTGCAVGAGKNNGTNWGISACAYPQLNIRGLTQAQARDIYYKDYWNPVQGDRLPWGVDLCTFDSGVNSGISRGAKWLQRAVGVPADGRIGDQTIAAAVGMDPHVIIDRMCDDRLAYLQSLPTWPIYGGGWTTLVKKVRDSAHDMAEDHRGDPLIPTPAPVPVPDVEAIEIVVRKPRGSKVQIVLREEET